MKVIHIKVLLALSLLLFSMNFVSAEVGDSIEEAEVAVLGENLGILTSQGDEHWFVFEANPDQGYLIELYGEVDTDLDMEILDENQWYIEGIYGVEYPDATTVVGHALYYLRVYSAWGEGEFTVVISEYEIEQGYDESYPLPLNSNYQEFSTNSSLNEMWFTYSPIPNRLYQISFNLMTTDTYVNFDVYNSNPYENYQWGSGYNYSWSEDNTPAYIVSTESNFTVRAWFNGPELIEFGIRLLDSDLPPGATQENAIPLSVGETSSFTLLSNFYTYLRFEATDNDWYSFDFVSETNLWIDIELIGENGNYYDWVSQPTNSSWYTHVNPGIYFLTIRTWNDQPTVMDVTMGRESPPPGAHPENPLLLSLDPQEFPLDQQRYYLQAEVTPDTSYLLNWDFSGSAMHDISILVYEMNEWGYYDHQYSSWEYGNMGSFFFTSATGVVNIEIEIWNYESVDSLTLDIDEIENLPHSSQSDAKQAFIGENDGFTEYRGQKFWFVFNSEQDVYYTFDATFANWGSFEIFNENGDHLEYGDEGYSPTIRGNGGLFFIAVRPEDPGDLTLNIMEGERPDDLTEILFSQELGAGDFFEWEVAAQLPDLDEDYFPPWLADGNRIRMEVLVDQPRIDSYEPWTSVFDFTVNGQNPDDEYIGSLFIMPVEIREGDSVISGVDILRDMTGFDEIQEVDGQYILSISEDDGNYSASVEWVFDATFMNLVSLEYSESFDGKVATISIQLVDSDISGPSGGEGTDNGDPNPAIELPLSPVSAILALVTVPVLRRRLK